MSVSLSSVQVSTPWTKQSTYQKDSATFKKEIKINNQIILIQSYRLNINSLLFIICIYIFSIWNIFLIYKTILKVVLLFLVCRFFYPDQGMVSWPTADITCDYCSPESTVTTKDTKRNGNKHFGYEYRNTCINFLFPLTISYIRASLSGDAYCFKYALGDSNIFVHFHNLFKWEVLLSNLSNTTTEEWAIFHPWGCILSCVFGQIF